MKIIKIFAKYYMHGASEDYLHVRIGASNDKDEQILKQKFYESFLENRKKYINWWGAETVYNLGETLETTVKQLQASGEIIEIIKPEDGYWGFELRE